MTTHLSLLYKYWLMGWISFLFYLKCFFNWKNLWKQSIIQHKKLWHTTTMSFVSEPVCMPHCPMVETWFQGSESLLRISFSSGTRALRGQQRDGKKHSLWAGRWNHVHFCSIWPCGYLCLSKCLSVCLSYSLGLIFSQDFLTVLIYRKTDEYMQPLRNLMDLEWTWKVATTGLFKYFSISLVFMWIRFFWRQFYCSLIFAKTTVWVFMC